MVIIQRGQSKRDANAIGYAQTGDLASYPGGDAEPVALNGLSPTFGNIGRSAATYPYWTVEYLYTYGKASGLASAFLNYLDSAAAIADLRSGDYFPCPDSGSSRARALCAQIGS